MKRATPTLVRAFLAVLAALLLLPAAGSRASVDEIISLPFTGPPYDLVEPPPLAGPFTPLRWNLDEYAERRIPFTVNPGIDLRGGLALPPRAEIIAAFRAGFATWEGVPTASVGFAVSTPENPPRETGLDGTNLLTLADESIVGPGTLGATLIFALDRTGRVGVGPFATVSDFVNEIIEVDTAFNPAVHFTTDGSATGFDLQSVVTHELGHALGRDHTGLIHATMFGTGAPGSIRQRTLSQDDIAGISVIYPAGDAFRQAHGGIGGSVLRAGAPVFGAHVVALDSAGMPQVSALSYPDGSFHIPGLPPGTYTLYAEPLDGPSQPEEYDLGVLFSFSPGFATTFATEPVTVRAGEESEAVLLAVGGSGQLNLISLAAVDARGNDEDAPAGLVLVPGQRTRLRVSGQGISERAEVSVSGAGVTVVGGPTASPQSPSSLDLTLEVDAEAARGPRTLFLESNGELAALSGGVIVSDESCVALAPSASAQPLAPGEETSGAISVAGEEDRYRFQGRAGQFVMIAMLATAASQLDSFLELRSPEGCPLAVNDDTIGLSAVLQDVRLPRDGEYEVIGSAFGESTGEYTLLLTFADAPRGFEQPRGPLVPGDVVDGSVAEPGTVGETEVWALEVGGEERLTIRVSGVRSFDPFVELFDSTFALLGADDDSGAGRDALLQDMQLPAGRYFLRVSGAVRTFGSYLLALEAASQGGAASAERPFDIQLTLNSSLYRVGDPFSALLTVSGTPNRLVDLYLAFVLPDARIAYAIPEPLQRFSAEALPIERQTSLGVAPAELLSLSMPDVPVGEYAAIAATVIAGAPPSLTTIRALDVAFFQVRAQVGSR
ncbi:MAG: matrixin family metalloprotease [Candidatus Tectomicrobia bacterium]|nr:matrixin family metalloprotease [Candidatus Tectomicrobia bacterium]